MLGDFRKFLETHNVLGMAIGVIIGSKLNDLVSSIVNDLTMPLILQPALAAAQVDDIRKLSWNGVFYGKVIGAGLDFLIVASIVFLFMRFFIRQNKTA
jgi:large conductance mechanosensitive channel